MNYLDILLEAREKVGKKCRVCKVCNGIVCRGEIPGVGGKGTGEAFIRNYAKLQEIKLNMNTTYEAGEIDTSSQLFGMKIGVPVFAGPIGGLLSNYGSDFLDDYSYSKAILEGCKEAGTIGFLADGLKEESYLDPLKAAEELNGRGIPTIKPWLMEEVLFKIKIAEKAGVPAIAMDIDAAGLTVLAQGGKPVKPKAIDELKAIIKSTKLPFILKGVMSMEGAMIALEAGAYAIVVSNHGGRVLDQTPATIEVLAEIVEAVGDKMAIFIDGGIRTGIDVFRCLALGADGVIIGRPYAVAAFGGLAEGVKLYTEKLESELKDTMLMTGCKCLAEITPDKVRII